MKNSPRLTPIILAAVFIFVLAVSAKTNAVGIALHPDADGTNPETGSRPPIWETMLRADLGRMAENLTASLKPWPVPDRVFLVEDYGAIADDKTDNAKSVQKAIDACAAAGGGTVLLTKGVYLLATIQLKNGVMLEVGKKAALKDILAKGNSSEPKSREMIIADGCERVGIRGLGEIVGQNPVGNYRNDKVIKRRLFLFLKCKKVVMDGIHVRNNGMAKNDFRDCDDVIIQGINVENQACRYNDGIDFVGCRNVIVRDCFVNSEDDACCFKGDSRDTENVLVENCRFYTTCNAIKFGTGSKAGFRNVVVRNVEVGGSSADMPAINRRLATSGMAWESADGGVVENILCTQVHIVRTRSPIFLRLEQRSQAKGIGIIRRVIYDHISGDNNGLIGSIIAGIPGGVIKDVIVRDARIVMAGGGEVQKPKPELVDSYPDGWMFGPQSPAYGFWLRHASNVAFFNVAITPQKPDARPAYFPDVDTRNIALDGKDILLQ